MHWKTKRLIGVVAAGFAPYLSMSFIAADLGTAFSSPEWRAGLLYFTAVSTFASAGMLTLVFKP